MNAKFRKKRPPFAFLRILRGLRGLRGENQQSTNSPQLTVCSQQSTVSLFRARSAHPSIAASAHLQPSAFSLQPSIAASAHLQPSAFSLQPSIAASSHLQPSAFSLQPFDSGAPRRSSGGFTLMEVNIALLIMAVGLMGVLALFPVGLRQGDSATSDTTEAAFANLVLNAMRSNVQLMKNWSDWAAFTNNPTGKNLGVAGISHPPTTGGSVVLSSSDDTTGIIGDGAAHEINDYLVKGQYIQYALHLEPDPTSDNNMVIKAWIQVTNRRYTDITLTPVYATSFAYMGM